VAYPLMFRLRQRFRCPRVDNVPQAVEAELAKLHLDRRVHRGETVAIACGSRKIANYSLIVKCVVDHLKRLNARPFIVPAMGIHAGGTAENQLQALNMLGITEESVGAEIRSSMEVDVIGHLPEGVAVYCDRSALAANHIFVINRVRPHSALDGEVQSGLLKMLTMGLGKQQGALIYHKALAATPFADLARGVWKVMLDKGHLLAGLMLVENGHSATARIQAALAEDFVEAERKMLNYATSLFPRLPFRFIDLLLVDEIGTTFGCQGVDLNVVGRKQTIHGTTPGEVPRIRALVFRDLHAAAMGNAMGIGHADLVRSRLLRKMDTALTRLNALTITIPGLASIPIHFDTDREILDAALSMTCPQPRENARIVWIRNTASLDEFECSEAFAEEARHWTDLIIASELHPLEFDTQGNLRDFVVGAKA
jgi:hypothetical protein